MSSKRFGMRKTAFTTALAIVAVSLAWAADAVAYRRHGRAFTSESPVYWGVERRTPAYRSCTGWCWPWENASDASVRQLDPRLRARSDGRLLEEVGTPPPLPDAAVLLLYSSGPAVTALPKGFWNGHFWNGNGYFWNGHGFWGGARGYRFSRGRR